MSSRNLSKEEIFNNKMKEMGLHAKYRERTREQYGVTQYRLEIRILRGQDEICFTTGGFWDARSYRESGFEQGMRRLISIEEQMGTKV